jgi:hypothetical protein
MIITSAPPTAVTKLPDAHTNKSLVTITTFAQQILAPLPLGVASRILLAMITVYALSTHAYPPPVAATLLLPVTITTLAPLILVSLLADAIS